MKHLLLACAAVVTTAAAQTSIHSGSGTDQKSNAYEFAGPYVLTWTLRDLPPAKRDDPHWKPTTSEGWKDQWLSVTVNDAATGRRICGEVVHGRDGWLNVPAGGKHHVTVSAWRTIAWTMHGQTGRMEITAKGPALTKATEPAAKQPDRRPIRGRAMTDAELEEITRPVPEPAPSSVPGLPPGVEPAKKKADPALPPGMTKGGAP